VIETLILVIILMLLLALDLAACGARSAFQESSYPRLLNLRDEFEARAERTVELYHAYPRVLASLNLVLVMMRFLLAGWALFVFSRQVPTISWWLALLVLLATGLALFVIEHSVASGARRDPERNAVRLSLFMRILVTLVSPLTALPLAFSKEAARSVEPVGAVTEDALNDILDAGQEEGVIEQGERQMINSVIDLGDTLVREIMVPRIDMLALEVATSLTGAIDAFLISGHSRLPVYEDNVDHMLGLLYAKDLLRVWREGIQLDSLRSLLRPAHYVPEAKRVYDLLSEMQSRRIHMAFVVDEYGGIAGVVTLEDIVEEIFGEIRDEYDQAEELPYQVLKNGDTIFQGRIDLDDFNETMGSQLPTEEADTLGGYIYNELGHIPELGETIQFGRLRLIVEQVSARRIHKVRARWILPEDKEEDDHVNG
jgi:putative hemolysin